MKKSGKRREEPANSWSAAAAAMTRGSVLAFVLTVALMLVCAVLESGGGISQHGAIHWAPAVCVPGAFTGALAAMHGRRDLALPLGVGVGAGLFLFLVVLGMALSGGAVRLAEMPVILCACMCGGIMAGIFGRRKGKKKRRK